MLAPGLGFQLTEDDVFEQLVLADGFGDGHLRSSGNAVGSHSEALGELGDLGAVGAVLALDLGELGADVGDLGAEIGDELSVLELLSLEGGNFGFGVFELLLQTHVLDHERLGAGGIAALAADDCGELVALLGEVGLVFPELLDGAMGDFEFLEERAGALVGGRHGFGGFRELGFEVRDLGFESFYLVGSTLGGAHELL